MANPFGKSTVLVEAKRAMVLQERADQVAAELAAAQEKERAAAAYCAAALETRPTFLALADGDERIADLLQSIYALLRSPQPTGSPAVHPAQVACKGCFTGDFMEEAQRILEPIGIVLDHCFDHGYNLILMPGEVDTVCLSKCELFQHMNGPVLAKRIAPWLEARAAHFANELNASLLDPRNKDDTSYLVACEREDQRAVSYIGAKLEAAGSKLRVMHDEYYEPVPGGYDDRQCWRLIFVETE